MEISTLVTLKIINATVKVATITMMEAFMIDIGKTT